MMRPKNKRYIVFSILAIAVLGIVSLYFTFGIVNASDRPLDHGYFNNEKLTSTGNKVIRGGVPSSVNSKAEFINFIEDLYYHPAKTLNGRNNKVGVAYIVQTMRGADPSTGKWDHSFPSDADIKQWEGMINDNKLDVDWSQMYSGEINSRSYPAAPSDPTDLSKRDVAEYDSRSTTKYESIVFFEKGHTSHIYYVVKRACGNPLGSLQGLPTTLTDFSLEPTISLSTGMIEAGSSFNVTPTITNSGTTTSATATYQLVKTITNPNSAGATTSGTGTFSAKNTTNVLGYPETSTDYTPGTHICFVLTVTPHSNTDSGAVSSSPPACVVIGKKPKVQVWGGDLLVGGNTDTSTSSKSGKTFGSWVEYAIFAVGNIKNTASGAAFAGQGIATSASSSFACDYSKLSFANAPSTATNYATANCSGLASTIGHYSNFLSAPDVAARFPTNSSTPVVPGADLSSLSGVYTANTNLIITGGTIPKGKWVVINAPNRDITITGNINYTNGVLHNTGDIPQVVIIANNITINSSVINVDAWLIAKNGNIYTCETDPKTVSDCANQLVVNGPVIANKLFLRRTAGSDKCNGSDCSPSGKPAEIFNLRADAYLWGYGLSAGDGKIQTVHTTELPPRL